ncbi:hypothetical protein Tco_0956492 [Tanacetum coccineum]
MLKKGNSKILLQDHAMVDSGCSSHMTGNKAYLSYYKDFNGGFVAFGSDSKGGAAAGSSEGHATKPAEPHHTPVDPIPSTSQPPIHSLPYSPPHSPPHLSHQSPPFYHLITHHLGPMKHLSLKDIDDDPLVSLVRESMKMKKKSTDFVTPTKASGEAQEEDISPTILEAAKTLSKVASQSVSKVKSTDKGKRYRRRARSVAKNINTGLDAEEEDNTGREEINTGREEINTGIEDVSTGSTKVDSGTASKRGQREGKAPMVEEDIQATHKTKEQIRQEEAGLEEAIRLQAQMDEEKRKAQVQFEAQYYTEEDWDAIRAKLEANTELTKDVLGKDFPEQDFAKRMVDIVNQRKKHFAEERAKAKRNKPMTQSHALQTITSKKQKIDDKDVSAIGEKVAENEQGDSETDKEESMEAINPTPLATKSNSVVNWKIFQQAFKRNLTRDDLIELYMLVMQKYGTNRLEDAYDRVLWSDLKTMFDPPLNEDAIWSLPLQQKMVSWRYYDKCAVHCLTLEACTIYMLTDRKYPLSKDACQVILKMKLLDETMDEVCYKLLKMIEKQAGISKV